MYMELYYKGAGIHDCQFLTETAKLSKLAWGYSSDQMKLWEEDLRIDKNYILKNTVAKIFVKEKFIGFFALVEVDSQTMEIDHLWLLPEEMRKGYGSLVFKHIQEYCKTNNFATAVLMADPNAKGFYEKMNGVLQGKLQSKIKDRYLYRYHFNL